MIEQISDQPLVCYNHPNRETSLRCNNCDRPICNECAIRVPTGYRCKECVRGQQKKFETTQWMDYPLAVVVSGVLAYLGSYLASIMGFFTIFIAPIAGVVIAEAVRWVVKRRRSRLLFRLAAGAAAVGALIPVALILIGILISGNAGGLLRLLWPGIYTFLITSTVYYRLSGIQMK